MKILILIQNAGIAGTEQATLAACRILKTDGHEVLIHALYPDSGFGVLCRAEKIPLTSLRKYHGGSGIFDVFPLLRMIRSEKPDRIWLVGHNLGTLLAAGTSGVRTMLSIHYHHSETAYWKWKIFYRNAAGVCTKIHFVSQYILDEVRRLIPPEKARCFHNMLNVRSNRAARNEALAVWGIPENSFVVGNAGQLIGRKRFDIFLQTAFLCAKEIPSARFIIAGDGEERSSLEQKVRELGLQDRVIFAGWLADMENFWGALNVLLFNSDFDSLGLTPLEAMSRGIPAVTSVIHGGLGEILTGNGDGILLKEHDPVRLATEIVKIAGDRKYAALLGEAGRQKIAEKCSEAVYRKKLEEFLELPRA